MNLFESCNQIHCWQIRWHPNQFVFAGSDNWYFSDYRRFTTSYQEECHIKLHMIWHYPHRLDVTLHCIQLVDTCIEMVIMVMHGLRSVASLSGKHAPIAVDFLNSYWCMISVIQLIIIHKAKHNFTCIIALWKKLAQHFFSCALYCGVVLKCV